MKDDQYQGENVLESSTFFYGRLALRVFGQWPFQTSKQKLFSRTSAALLIGSIILPSASIILEQWRNFNYVVLGLPSFLYYVEFVTKYAYLAANREKFVTILNRIRNDFDTFKGKKLDVLNIYAAKTRFCNNVYAAYLITVVVVFNVSFFESDFLDLVNPLNESRPKPVIRLARYYVTSLDESFNFVVLHGLIVDFYSMIFFLGHDTLLVNCAQHACALFQITIIEIQDCLDSQENEKTDGNAATVLDDNLFYDRICKVARQHKYALEFTTMVDAMYTYVNLCIIGTSLMAITLGDYEAVVNLNKNVGLVIKYLVFSIGEIVHILYFSWPGQIIQDQSLVIYKACYNCEWYRNDVSDRCKQLLKLIMLRSQSPSKLTAGKLYVLGYDNYAKVLKASMSFFMMLLSMN